MVSSFSLRWSVWPILLTVIHITVNKLILLRARSLSLSLLILFATPHYKILTRCQLIFTWRHPKSSQGSPFHFWTALIVMKFFLTFHLNLPLCSFQPLLLVLPSKAKESKTNSSWVVQWLACPAWKTHLPEFKSGLGHFLTVWPWAHPFCLNFLICKISWRRKW